MEAEQEEQDSNKEVDSTGRRKLTETNLLKLIMNNRNEEKK